MTGDDHALARDLAGQAGTRLLELRAQGGDPDVLRKAGDRLSHEFLTAALAGRRPGDVVLSEEGADNPGRRGARRVWIVDPLDGTREFGEPGRTDWAVHVALWEARTTSPPARSRCPPRARVLSTLEPPPAPPADAATARIRIVVSRSRPPGSFGIFLIFLMLNWFPWGRRELRWRPWSTARSTRTCTAAGSTSGTPRRPSRSPARPACTRPASTGPPSPYNQADLLMPDILVCRPAVAGMLLQAIREVTHAP